MRIIEIDAGGGNCWTLEIQPAFEHRIAASLGRDPYAQLSDEDIKDFFLESIMKDHEVLSLEIVKG